MKQTINFSQFVDAFNIRKDQFSYDGLKALYDYFTELEDDGIGEEIELDVIALCCEYSEFVDISEYNSQYGDTDNVFEIEDIEKLAIVIRTDNGEGFITSQH